MQTLVRAVEETEGLTLPAWLSDEFLDTDPEQFQLSLAAAPADPDPWHLLGRIRARTVLIAGSDEDLDRTLDIMAARIRDARSVHVAGVGHVGAFLRTDEVCAAALPTLLAAAG